MNYFNKTKENFLPFHHNQDRKKQSSVQKENKHEANLQHLLII